MTDTELLQKIQLDIAEIKGAVNTLAVLGQKNAEDIKKVEGRQWGLVIMVLGAFGTSLLSFFINSADKAGKVSRVVESFLSVF